MKSKPIYPFQERVRAFCRARTRIGIFVGYGGGKTYLSLQWLDDLLALGYEMLPALVLVLNSTLTQWGEQIEQHSNFSYVLLTGDVKKREKLLKRQADIYVANYDFLRSPRMRELFSITRSTYKTREGKIRHLFRCTKTSPFKTVIADESTILKEERTQRFRALNAFCKRIPNRAILTGKPILEKPEEIFSQCLFMDDGAALGTSFWKFRYTYFTEGPTWDPYKWELKDSAAAEIGSKLSSNCIRVDEEEINKELPPKRYIKVYFDMPKSVRERYRQLKRDFYVESLTVGEWSTQWAVSRSQKMHQLCQGIFYTTEGYELLHTLKLDWLRENIPLMLREGPVLIWTDLVRLIPLIAAMLIPIPLRTYSGAGMTEREREDARGDFCSGKVDLLILSEAKGYAGLNLQRANKAVFVSNGYPANWRENAEKRNHRPGSEKYEHVTYYDLLVKKSIDEVILRAIQEKLDMAKEIMNHVRTE